MANQMGQEEDGFFFADGGVEDLEVEVPESHTGCHRDGLPIEVVLQDRGLASWRPGAAAMRSLTQPAFVDEDNGAALFLGFFLMAGQVFRFHSAIASSFRSSARPTGRCGLQFSCRNNFQT